MELTERQKEIYNLYHELGCSETRVSKKIEISETAVGKHLFLCAKKGFSVKPNTFIEQAPAGFGLTKSTLQVNKDGDVIQRWDRISPFKFDADQFSEYLRQRIPLTNYEPRQTVSTNKELMAEWLIYDMHLGMHSWGKQTGEAYDTKIARRLMESAAEKIYGHIGTVKESLIVLGGDNLHSDSRSNQTEKSRHALDVDTRYQKSIEAMREAALYSIEIAANHSERVKVIVLSGNHDYHASIAITLILDAYYRDIDKIEIDTSPAKHRFHRFGGNYFLYTHGDTGTDKRLSGYLLNHLVDNGIQGVKRKLVRKGHIHKKGRLVIPNIIEEDGVVIEYFPTLAAKDAYAHEHAYLSDRATVANLWHSEYGQRSRIELGVDELLN